MPIGTRGILHTLSRTWIIFGTWINLSKCSFSGKKKFCKLPISYDAQEHLHIISNTHIALKPTWFGVVCSAPVGSLNLPHGIPTALCVPCSYSHLQQSSDGLSHICQVLGILCNYKPPRFRPTSGFLLLAFQQGTGMTAASWVFFHLGCSTLCAAGRAGITTLLEVRVTQ